MTRRWRLNLQRNNSWISSTGTGTRTATGWWDWPRVWWWHGYLCFIIIPQKFCFQLFHMYSVVLQIIILWVVVPEFIWLILICSITLMTQQPQVVMHINQAFSSVFIQPVSSHIMYEAVGAPIPLCRRSIHNLWEKFFCQLWQKSHAAICFPPCESIKSVSIFHCMQRTKQTSATEGICLIQGAMQHTPPCRGPTCLMPSCIPVVLLDLCKVWS